MADAPENRRDAAGRTSGGAPAPEDTCADAIAHAIGHTDGIVAASVDAASRSVEIDYDPAKLADQDVLRVAADMAPVVRHQFEKCTLRLAGRACEACAMRLERKARRIDGVRRATASFQGGLMSVTYDTRVLEPDEVMRRVAGTGAPVRPYVPPFSTLEKVLGRARTLREAAYDFLTGDTAETLCMLLTFVAMMAGWLSEKALLAPGWHHAFYTVAYLAGGFFGVQAGLRSLRQLTIDVDLLMVLAALGAAYIGKPFEGAMLLFLFSLSNVLQSYAMDRTRRAIEALMELRPETASRRRGGVTETVPIEELAVGDVVIVRPGERVPLDGVVVEGASSLDQSSITGESMPVDKEEGDPVFGGSINKQGALEVRVTRLATDSTLAKLIRMVEEAQSQKAATQRFLDRAEQWYAGGVLLFTAALILVPWLAMNGEFAPAFYRAVTVMVVASPCALIISTPASYLSAIGGAARRGVLFKGGAHLETTASVKVVAFDKTGTLTEGRPRVTDVVSMNDNPLVSATEADRELLTLAASVEAKSEHVIAQAIVEAAQERGVALVPTTSFQSAMGLGARGVVDGHEIALGSLRYFDQFDCVYCDNAGRVITRLQDEGKTAIIVARMLPGGRARVIGVIAVADVLRPEAARVVRALKQSGVGRVVMLTGDSGRVATAIGAGAGVDEVHADLLPEDKVEVIRRLRAHGPVAMVGDGVNDAPALAAADLGIAMGAAGTDVAMETADVVLMASDLSKIPYAIALGRQARRVVVQNLAFAMAVIVVLVAITLGLHLPLTFGVIGHEGSTVLVVLNGLRLLVFGGGTAR